MEKEKTIYNLELHETLKLLEERIIIKRVYKGWIYQYYATNIFNKDEFSDKMFAAVFVPED